MSHVATQNRKVANRYNPVRSLYSDMPRHYQAAIAMYYSVCGSAWQLPPILENICFDVGRTISEGVVWSERRYTQNFLKNLDFYVVKYGNKKFWTVEIPTDVITTEIMSRQSDAALEFDSFEEYHKWYVTTNLMPNHNVKKPLWPCFLSCYPEEVFEDGWHRFHDYYRKGVEMIPCVM